MAGVKFEDLASAFDFVSFDAPGLHRASILLNTGKIYWFSEMSDINEEDDEDEDEIPDDPNYSERYLQIPHKTELGLGRNLALRFVEEQLPARYDQVERFFQRRGAYARFKDLLERENALERWYAFEADTVEKTLRKWAASNGLEIID